MEGLIGIIGNLLARSAISHSFAHHLEVLVLRQDEVLLAAYSCFVDENLAHPEQARAAWADFLDTLAHIELRLMEENGEDAEERKGMLQTSEMMLIDIINSMGKEHVIVPAEHAFLLDLQAQGDSVLEAAFRLYQASGDGNDFEDSLISIAARWSAGSQH